METVVWIGIAVLVGIALLVATISRKGGGGSRPAGSRTVRAAVGTDNGGSSWGGSGWGGDSGGGGGDGGGGGGC